MDNQESIQPLTIINRSRKKIVNQKVYGIGDYYKFYSEDVKGNRLYEMDRQKYNYLCKEIFKEMKDMLMEESMSVYLPMRMGQFCIRKYKAIRNNRAVDWVASKIVGKIVREANLHTMGFRFILDWHRDKNNVKGIKRHYRIDTCRTFNRELANKIKSGYIDYMDLDPETAKSIKSSDTYESKKHKGDWARQFTVSEE